MDAQSGGVLLVATTRNNVSPAMVLELLGRMGNIIKDHTGVLSEDAIRKNFIIIYELLDEAIDYGFPQNASTESLKTFVLNEPCVVVPPVGCPPSLAPHRLPPPPPTLPLNHYNLTITGAIHAIYGHISQPPHQVARPVRRASAQAPSSGRACATLAWCAACWMAARRRALRARRSLWTSSRRLM